MNISKHSTSIKMLLSALFAVLATIALLGATQSSAQVSTGGQQSTKTVTVAGAPSTGAPAQTTPKKATLTLSAGLAAIRVDQFISIATGADDEKLIFPSTDDLAKAATLCPDNSFATGPSFTTGSHRQLIGGEDDWIGDGSADIAVTVKTHLTCVPR